MAISKLIALTFVILCHVVGVPKNSSTARPKSAFLTAMTGEGYHGTFALMAGGGWRMGQVIGRTNAWAAAPVGTPYTPQNVLTTIYRHLGIDPATPLKDHSGRPHPLLDDCAAIKELA
jgi:hypothetical protein